MIFRLSSRLARRVGVIGMAVAALSLGAATDAARADGASAPGSSFWLERANVAGVATAPLARPLGSLSEPGVVEQVHRRRRYRRYRRYRRRHGFAPFIFPFAGYGYRRHYGPPVGYYPRRSYRRRGCGYWSDQCARNWGYRNNNYYGCLRYHGCR